jgi:hypothetical protein
MSKGTKGTGEEVPDYLAYLLRLWRVRGKGTTGWRASLESPGSGKCQGFSSMDDLFLFLRRQTLMLPDADDAKESTR